MEEFAAQDEMLSQMDPQVYTRPKRSSKQVRQENQRKWEKSCQDRHVNNERHLDSSSFDATNQVVQAIARHGLTYFLHPNAGYNLSLVRFFYKNIKVPAKGEELEEGSEIRSNIARRRISITPDIIAATMGYVRPLASRIRHHVPEHFTTRQVFEALYENPNEAHIPHVPGRFKDDYKLLNQFMAYNLFPRQKENSPEVANCLWMVAFMDPQYTYDWALHLYLDIIEFRGVNLRARLPYPCLITRICRHQMDYLEEYAKNDKLELGYLNRSVLARSAAQTMEAAPYLMAPPKKSTNVIDLLRMCFCQNVAIMKSLRKEKEERRRFEWEVKHEVAYVRRKAEGSSEPFVPLQGLEPEVSDDFATGTFDDEDEEEEESD